MSATASAPVTNAEVPASQLDMANLPMQLPSEFGDSKTDFAIFASQDMALIHNMLMSGWNSIYQQAPLIIDKDKPDFISYCYSWWRVVELHHNGEEASLYPSLEKAMGKPGFFGDVVTEHAAFHDGLDAFKAYLVECKPTPSSFDGTKLRSIMDTFGAALYSHMNHEPHLIRKAQGYDDKALRKLWDEHAKENLGSASLFSEIPLMWCNFDATQDGGRWANFPDVPAPVKWFMRNLAPRWHANVWRFGSTTTTGTPIPLLALREGYGK